MRRGDKRGETNRIFVENEAGKRYSSSAVEAGEAVGCTLALLRKKNAAISVFLIRDASMRRLNRVFRGKDRPTTVLSFEAGEGFPHPEAFGGNRFRGVYLGEVYLAPRHITRKRETVSRMAVHGCLHLLGYTHKKNDDRMEMEKCERRALRCLVKRRSVPQ